MPETRQKQAYTKIATADRLRNSQLTNKSLDLVKLRYAKAFSKAKIDSKTEKEMTIDNLEKVMIVQKFDHFKYDP